MEGEQQTELASARKGLLRAIWCTSVAPRFSSRPIMEDYLLDRSRVFGNSTGSVIGGNDCQEHHHNNNSSECESTEGKVAERIKNSLRESSNLTTSEHNYLEQLLRSDDLDSIRRASTRLADKEIFPAADDDEHMDIPTEKCGEEKEAMTPSEISLKDSAAGGTTSSPQKNLQRRDSQVQQQLFQWHENGIIMPSAMLRRMSDIAAAKASRPLFITHNNSLTQDDEEPMEDQDLKEEKSLNDNNSNNIHQTRELSPEAPKWNPLKDLNAWINGSEGVEVNDEGTPEISSPTSNPFKILGTSANDISCHPHVLSPPLMEGLQLFMPESLQDHHYWLKYSLVREGPSLLKMLRHCRASQHTILAIETTDGHVFGSFTSQPWRLISTKGYYYGNKESFVWRMRRSRNEVVKSVVEQILMESQIDVYPFTGRNNKVQMCTKDCIALGHGELQDDSIGKDNNHEENVEESHSLDSNEFFGLAIKLDKSMTRGTTSSSETFGNPCLVERGSRGETFEVANIELWSLTPHETVEEADRAEMRSLFLEENRHAGSNLNLIEILVGGAHI
jgi:hypothetical protein